MKKKFKNNHLAKFAMAGFKIKIVKLCPNCGYEVDAIIEKCVPVIKKKEVKKK